MASHFRHELDRRNDAEIVTIVGRGHEPAHRVIDAGRMGRVIQRAAYGGRAVWDTGQLGIGFSLWRDRGDQGAATGSVAVSRAGQ